MKKYIRPVIALVEIQTVRHTLVVTSPQSPSTDGGFTDGGLGTEEGPYEGDLDAPVFRPGIWDGD